MTATPSPLADLALSHVELYVADADAQAAEMAGKYGFRPVADRRSADGAEYSIALRQGEITMVLTQGLWTEHPAHCYVQLHGDGVADIAFHTLDVKAAFDEAVARGATPAARPTPGADGGLTAGITAFGDVRHTFLQRPPAGGDALPAGFNALPERVAAEPVVSTLDHFAVVLNAGELDSVVAFYRDVLGFSTIFEERIEVGAQAMNSRVVQNLGGDVTLTLIEPDPDREAGQINDFLKDHGGQGIQHIAFSSTDITHAVATLRDRGVDFLTTPACYYDLVADRIPLPAHEVAKLSRHGILVDTDHDGRLLQIFTRSAHPRRTIFFEVIQRLGARTFGSGNIKALYEAVERDRIRGEGVRR
jgi:4-hydroxymandelate synthase